MSRIQHSADVAIIGASLAGSACAIELARQGVNVILIDRVPFPRRKACGEGLSYLAAPHLNRLGFGGDTLKQLGLELFGYRLYKSEASGCNKIETTVRTDAVRCWGAARHDLDSELLNCASKLTSIRISVPELVKTITRNRASWELTTDLSRISARFLVLASGAHPQALARPFIRSKNCASTRVGLSAHAELVNQRSPREVVIIPFRDGEIYVTPLPNGALNVSLVGTPAFIQSKRDPRALATFIRDVSGLELTVNRDFVGASHFESKHESLDPSLYLVGDALESFDPACGLGMTHALVSGIKAAKSILHAHRDYRRIDYYASEYARWHAGLASSIRRYSRILRTLISSFQRFPRGTAIANRILGGVTIRLIDSLARPLQLEND